MNEKYELLYNEMLEDIQRSLDKELPESENVPNAFWIAQNYWKKLKESVMKQGLKTQADEIEFFRNVKPKFTSHIEFYTIISEALLCVPEDKAKAMEYWDNEGGRFRRFCDKHHVFVQYYESGKHHNDILYFVRPNSGINYIPKSPVYDVEPEFCSSHDQLVRSYLANKMYYEYCRKKMMELSSLTASPYPSEGKE